MASSESSHPTPSIELTGASVHYGGAPALRGVTLAVSRGERVALLGRSGAGKSTLLRALNGSTRLSEGGVTVLGVDLSAASPRELRAVRRRIGHVAQALDLPGPLRVSHNVNAGRLGTMGTTRAITALMSRRTDSLVADALARVKLDGLHDRRTDELSGGEQQRVAVARVLVQRPDVILGDEPASSLDPELARVIASALTGATDEADGTHVTRTVVLSLHNPELARRYCTRIVGLVKGAVVFDAPAGEVSDADLDRIYAGGDE